MTRTALIGIAVLLLSSACGGHKALHEAAASRIPDWYQKQPEEDDYLFAAMTATSQDMQLSVDLATANARTELARQVGVHITSQQDPFQGQTGGGQEAELTQVFQQVSGTFVSQHLIGSKVREQLVSKDDGIWRAYVLMEFPLGEANSQLMRALQANRNLRAELEATEAWNDLKERAEKYEAQKRR